MQYYAPTPPLAWTGLTVLAVVNAAVIRISVEPLLALQAQDPALLALAIRIRDYAPLVAVVSFVLLLYFGLTLFRSPGWMGRVLATALGLVVVGGAVTSIANLAEVMFAKAPEADFISINNQSDLKPDDMVIGVIIDGKPRAYPVRYLAYHHMLNDSFAGTKLLPNY